MPLGGDTLESPAFTSAWVSDFFEFLHQKLLIAIFAVKPWLFHALLGLFHSFLRHEGMIGTRRDLVLESPVFFLLKILILLPMSLGTIVPRSFLVVDASFFQTSVLRGPVYFWIAICRKEGATHKRLSDLLWGESINWGPVGDLFLIFFEGRLITRTELWRGTTWNICGRACCA